MTKHVLTPKQQHVFDFLQRYIQEHRQSPLIREIQLACEIVSYKSAVDRLNALDRKGFIRRAPNKHRGIRLARRAVMESQVPLPQPTTPSEGIG